MEILRSGAPRIHEVLDQKYGSKRLDSEATEATDLANKVRKEILEELEAL
jgi:hypothetical protein